MPKLRSAPTTFDQWVGQTIDAYMKKRGMRQADLADRTGIPDTLVGRIIRGARHVTVREFEIIAGVLGVPAGRILDEALNDFGGMEKLLATYVPGDAATTGDAGVDEIARVIGEQKRGTNTVSVAAFKRAAAMSAEAGNVDPAENVTYLGDVTPPLSAAADTGDRIPSRD